MYAADYEPLPSNRRARGQNYNKDLWPLRFVLSIATTGRLLHTDVCGHVVDGLFPLDSPEQGIAGSGSLEAGTSLGKRGSQPPGKRPGETGAEDASLQTGVGEQAANGVREVGASGVVL